MRNENTHCQGNCERLKVFLNPYDRDKRTRYIEYVLHIMNESRFGPHRGWLMVAQRYEEPVHYIPVIYDLMPGLPLPSIAMEIFKREAVERDVAARRLDVISDAAAEGSASRRPPTTLARGSPSTQTDVTQ